MTSRTPCALKPTRARRFQRAALAREEATQGQARLVYVDESHLHLLPLLLALWIKGRRVRVPTPGQNVKHAFCGALDAVSGQWFWADHPRKLAVPAGGSRRLRADDCGPALRWPGGA